LPKLPVLPKIAEIAVGLPRSWFFNFGNYQILAIADITLLSSRD